MADTKQAVKSKPVTKNNGPWWMLRDSKGKKSFQFTMLAVSFYICTGWLTLSIFEKIHHLEIREFDATGAMVWISPFCALYFGRKWSQNKAVETLEAQNGPPASETNGEKGSENEEA